MSQTRVAVNGAKGRMGREVVAAVRKDPNLVLVAEVDQGDSLTDVIKKNNAEVVVDFTSPAAVYENTLAIISAGAHPVIGTTGLQPGQIQELKSLCREKKLGGLVAPNFAIGAVLMMKFSVEAARYLPHLEIIELHHDGKADAPSGTALKTAEMINAVRPPPDKKIPRHNYEYEGIPIHSVRLPGLVAHQEVIFGGLGQTLTIRHDSLSRESFMPGVCLACKKVVALQELVYGLENLL